MERVKGIEPSYSGERKYAVRGANRAGGAGHVVAFGVVPQHKSLRYFVAQTAGPCCSVQAAQRSRSSPYSPGMSQAGTITQLVPGEPGRMNRPQQSHFGI